MGNVSEFPLGGFKWVEETSQFNEDFIINYNKDSDIGCFIETDAQYSENCMNVIRFTLFA